MAATAEAIAEIRPTLSQTSDGSRLPLRPLEEESLGIKEIDVVLILTHQTAKRDVEDLEEWMRKAFEGTGVHVQVAEAENVMVLVSDRLSRIIRTAGGAKKVFDYENPLCVLSEKVWHGDFYEFEHFLRELLPDLPVLVCDENGVVKTHYLMEENIFRQPSELSGWLIGCPNLRLKPLQESS